MSLLLAKNLTKVVIAEAVVVAVVKITAADSTTAATTAEIKPTQNNSSRKTLL